MQSRLFFCLDLMWTERSVSPKLLSKSTPTFFLTISSMQTDLSLRYIIVCIKLFLAFFMYCLFQTNYVYTGPYKMKPGARAECKEIIEMAKSGHKFLPCFLGLGQYAFYK